jgi:O-antigen/teichoic acid export membrane protein
VSSEADRPTAKLSSSLLITTLISTGLTGAIGLAASVATARLLGTNIRGELAAMQTVAGVMTAIGGLGLAPAAAYFAAQRPDQAQRIWRYANTIMLAWFPMIFGIGIVALAIVFHPISQTFMVAGITFLLAAIPLHILSTSAGIGRMSMSDVRWNVIRTMNWYAWGASVAVVVILQSKSLITLGLVHLGFLALAAGWAVLTTRSTVRRVDAARTARSARVSRQKLMRYGLPNVLQAVPNLLALRVDQVIIGAVLGSSVLGRYTVAAGWSSLVYVLLAGVASSILAPVASASLADRAGVIRRAVRSSAAVAVAVVAIALIGTVVVFVAVFGEQYRSSRPLALALIGAQAIAGMNFVLADICRGLGQPKRLLHAEIAGLVVTLLAIFATITTFNEWAGVIGSFCGYGASMVTYMAFLHTQHATTPS